MFSIRKKLGVIILTCSILATIFTAIFVNVTINNKFNQYMADVQNKRNDRIVQYFEEVYKRDKVLTVDSGSEMKHEAYMSNYCLTLLDGNKKLVWMMDPNDIQEQNHLNILENEYKNGIFTTTDLPIHYNDDIVGYIQIGQYSSVLLSAEDVNFKLSINKSIMLSIIISLIIVIIVSIYISKQFSVPIKKISEISVKLSKGDYNPGFDIVTDISEIEHLRKSMNILGEKLKQQDLLRKRLVSDISHEIRTPLNIIQNNLEAMIDGVISTNNDQLVVLNDEVIRFGKLLNNLDTLKEFESKEISMSNHKIVLDQLIDTVRDGFSASLIEKNITVIYHAQPDKKYFVSGDEDKLKQVFINLLSNAVKFSEPDGKIWIDLKKNKNNIVASIRDEGTGIEKEDLPYIFERLYRGDKSRNLTKGSGIGLSIVKEILELHSASIDVESEKNKGTVFTMSFKSLD